METNVIEVNAVLDIMWIMIAGILVFFMQSGFTLVESGFTRSKNVINIVMKNFVDLAVGSLAFWFIGYTLMYGESISSFIGTPSLFYNVREDMHNLFFQTVFCATAATIVSGAVAERTKFTTYVIFSLIMTTLIYPISGHWVWQGDGWLTKLGFIDFAGSTVVHSVGGWAALVGAILVGPRIGKYTEGKSNAIPGHNMMFGALGVFILWLGWFGFNAGSELAISGESSFNAAGIIITTNLAAAAGADHLCLDPAPLLGPGHPPQGRIRQGRYSHAAGYPRQQVHRAAHPAVHPDAAGGEPATFCHRHVWWYLPDRCPGARLEVPAICHPPAERG